MRACRSAPPAATACRPVSTSRPCVVRRHFTPTHVGVEGANRNRRFSQVGCKSVAYDYISAMSDGLHAPILQRLKTARLRPTRQRVALAGLLFRSGDRHVTAEQLHQEALGDDVRVSLATVYNTLHQFTDARLLREVVVEAGRSYFDTNVSDHHHFFLVDSG